MTVPEFEAEIRTIIAEKFPLSPAEVGALVNICKSCFIAGMNAGGEIAIDIVNELTRPSRP